MRRPHAIVFDLDDTLYPYRAFARSGFVALAQQVAREQGVGVKAVVRALSNARRTDRGREVQVLCRQLGVPARQAGRLVETIREHTPVLTLPRASAHVLARLKPFWKIAILTNGTPRIQQRKIAALGVAPLVDAVLFATKYGNGRGKPARAPFQAVLDRLGVSPERTVFVGNDVHADMLGARRAGMHTIHFTAYDDRVKNCGAKDCGIHVRRLASVPRAAALLVGSGTHRTQNPSNPRTQNRSNPQNLLNL